VLRGHIGTNSRLDFIVLEIGDYIDHELGSNREGGLTSLGYSGLNEQNNVLE
jgi:hypothetical protein